MVDKPNLDPARTALLVMDYQVGLLRGLPDAQALLERVNTAVGDVRAPAADTSSGSEWPSTPPTSTPSHPPA